MISRLRLSAPRSTRIAGVATTVAALGAGALGLAALAHGQPLDPGAPPPPPGQPVIQPVAGGDAPPVAPPPMGPPMVPEIQNPGYGQNSSGGGGAFAFLREAWNMAQDPYGFTQIPPEGLPSSAPPPGAGPPPPLPPGYESLNAPGSETPRPETGPATGPPLPEGYYSINGPVPPGWYDAPPPDPMNPFGAVTPVAPAP